MKQFKYIFLMMACTFFLTACSQKEVVVKKEVSVHSKILAVESN